MAASPCPETKACAAAAGLQIGDRHVLHRKPVLLQEPGEREVGRGAGCGGQHRLALQVLDRGDVVAHHHAVGAVGLVELEDLLGRDAVGVPDDPGLDRGCSALDVAGGDRQVAVLLRDLPDADVEAVLLEDAGFLGQRQRRKSRPSRDADADLGLLRRRRSRQARAARRRRQLSQRTHDRTPHEPVICTDGRAIRAPLSIQTSVRVVPALSARATQSVAAGGLRPK